MGIKHFYGWFRKVFCNQISRIPFPLQAVLENTPNKVLAIDMNGIFHTSAQKIYKYGSYKPLQGLLRPVKASIPEDANIKVYEDILNTIKLLYSAVQPTKLVLCVDGCAPMSKQQQQRQRRFINKCDDFDSNCLSTGTLFMHQLTEYIKKRLTFFSCQVVFSSEKVCGEGEHKLINYIRDFGSDNETYIMHGLDADLIMLGLATHRPKFFILREDRMTNDYHLINIGEVSKEMTNIMRWSETSSYTFDPKTAVNDFIFMCFFVGNDFLPQIPAIEIMTGSVDKMMEIYKRNGEMYGHLTHKNRPRFRKTAFRFFLNEVSKNENKVLQYKYDHRLEYNEDLLLLNSAESDTVNLKTYKQEYYKRLPDSKTVVCHEYLKGTEWVLNYYLNGTKEGFEWRWRYNYYYAPFCSTLSKHIDSYTHFEFASSEPTLPFFQLLCILPTKSKNLLPSCLQEDLEKLNENIGEIQIDVSGKKEDWEGVVLVPFANLEEIENVYRRKEKLFTKAERLRNTPVSVYEILPSLKA